MLKAAGAGVAALGAPRLSRAEKVSKLVFVPAVDRPPLGRILCHFQAAWLRLKQTDLIPGKGQFR
jgi:hypothetical protein